jgi:hypothetical protein
MSAFGWLVTVLVLSCLAGAGIAGYVFYKYRLRVCAERTILSPNQVWINKFIPCQGLIPSVLQRYMDSEVMAIMAQYMPLESQHNENQPLRREEAEQA